MKVSYAMKHNKKCQPLNVAGYQKMAIAQWYICHKAISDSRLSPSIAVRNALFASAAKLRSVRLGLRPRVSRR